MSGPTRSTRNSSVYVAAGLSQLYKDAFIAVEAQTRELLKTRFDFEAVLQPNELQDLVDVLDDIVKAAVGVPLRFQLQISLGNREDIGSGKVEEVNKLLESVSPDLRVKA